MSFICVSCNQPAPKGFSPIVNTIQTRKEYYDEKKHLIGVGTETVKELPQCALCAGVEVKTPTTPDYSVEHTFANGFTKKHVRGCEGVKKSSKNGQTIVLPCPVCASVVEAFSHFKSMALAFALQETKATPAKFSLGLLLVHALNAQADRKGRRSHRDFAAGYRVLKSYEQRGGSI